MTAAALEPRAIRATFDNASSKYRLEVGTQTPNRIRPDLAIALGIEPDAIEIIAQDCGGSFGMKNTAFLNMQSVFGRRGSTDFLCVGEHPD